MKTTNMTTPWQNYYRQVNNWIFDYGCQREVDNCYFHLIYDKIGEHLYAKHYQNVFDQDISEFVSIEILER